MEAVGVGGGLRVLPGPPYAVLKKHLPQGQDHQGAGLQDGSLGSLQQMENSLVRRHSFS